MTDTRTDTRHYLLGFDQERFDIRLAEAGMPVGFRSDACWLWQGSRNPNGYGMQGRSYAHRLSYALAKGEIPDGLHIDHLCRQRACINPDHLEAVTQAENNRRAFSREVCKRGHSRWARQPSTGNRYCMDCAAAYQRDRRKATKA